MNISKIGRHASWLVLFCLLWSSGCASTKSSKFYMLQTTANLAVHGQTEKLRENIAIGVGPVHMPQYLDRPQIVTRNSRNEFELAEYDRWAEPVDENFTRVLAENLSTLLETNRILILPSPRVTSFNYQVVVDVIQFDAALGATASLMVRWTVLKDGGDKVLSIKKSNFSEPIPCEKYEALVSAESKLIADFAREIAETIMAAERKM